MNIQKVAQFIKEKKLFTLKEKIIVALSGGADSVTLLRMLLDLGYTCEAAHCNFHLRGEESDRDEMFVRNLCDTLQVNIHVQHFPTSEIAAQRHISIEMAARELRYEWFEQLRTKQKADFIAVAHHKDDSIETFLLNLIRGTGFKGLLGIRPKNDKIVRPLLCLTRQEIIEYLQEIDQTYVTDSTNLQDEYLRNKIRLNLLPQLQTINPSIKESLTRTTEYLNDMAVLYNKGIEDGKKRVQTNGGLSITTLLQEPAPETLLFEILHPLGFNASQIKDVFQSLQGQAGKTFSNNTWRVIKDREILLIEPRGRNKNSTDTPPFQYIIEEQDIPENFIVPHDKNIAFLDKDKLEGELHFRHWQQGDSFVPYGMTGRKKVSDYLTDKKYSVSRKEQQWVLCCGEQIAWLVGERTDNRYKIDAKTLRMIRVKIDSIPII